MKRSEINILIKESIDFFKKENFHLPPFAWIKPDEWEGAAKRSAAIIEAGLGWDVTDFNLGDFHKTGVLLFTLRNGIPSVDSTEISKSVSKSVSKSSSKSVSKTFSKTFSKTYCEKVIHIRKNQTCPTHFHKSKMEDIINRSGATLCFELHMAGEDNKSFSAEGFAISQDGLWTNCRPGEVVKLQPGESITIPPRLYHSFWAQGGDVVIGEVSKVNDDVTDNFFYEDIPRFMDIEEDEKPLYLLCHELQKFLD